MEVNLFDALNPEYYNKSNIRKREKGTSFYYRINCKLPNGTAIQEEQGGFSCVIHAQVARVARLKKLLQQDVRVEGKTLEDVFNEYLKTLDGKEPLKEKYTIYFNSFCKPKSTTILEELIIIKESKESCRGFLVSGIHYDKRKKESTKTCSKEYIRGFRAMLMNILDYAYLQGYISTQPLYYL